MFTKVRVREFERGLWFRRGDFKGLLGPGEYRFWSRLFSFERDRVEVVSTLDTRFCHPLLDVLAGHSDMRDALTFVELNNDQRALVWKDDRLACICGPGRHAFWKVPFELRVETFDINELRFDHPRAAAVLAVGGASAWLKSVEVESHQDGLLFRDGKFVERLGEGLHVFWTGAGKLNIRLVDRREQIADVAGQEIMTKDKVSLRLNLLVTYQVVDSVKAVTVVSDCDGALYREAQLALRAAVGTRTLDELLADKESVGGEIRGVVVGRAEEFGVAVRGVGLRDIILPGDMKSILNQVIEAEKRAQANLIRRREETAAARSQANTARLLAENPVLARMKELELVQEILAGTRAEFVFAPDDLVGQMRRLACRSGLDSG